MLNKSGYSSNIKPFLSISGVKVFNVHACSVVSFNVNACSVVSCCNPKDCSPLGSSCPGNFLGKNTGVDCYLFPTPRDLPDPGIKPSSPALPGRFFTIGPLRKSKMYLVLHY